MNVSLSVLLIFTLACVFPKRSMLAVVSCFSVLLGAPQQACAGKQCQKHGSYLSEPYNSPSPYQSFLGDGFHGIMQSVVLCPFLNAICHDPMGKVSNLGLHASSRADVVIFLPVHRRLTGRQDEHVPRGLPAIFWNCRFAPEMRISLK